MLVLESVGKTYPNGVHALEGVSLTVYSSADPAGFNPQQFIQQQFIEFQLVFLFQHLQKPSNIRLVRLTLIGIVLSKL